MYQNKDPSKNLTCILYYEFDFTTLYEIGLKKLPKELHLQFFCFENLWQFCLKINIPEDLLGSTSTHH